MIAAMQAGNIKRWADHAGFTLVEMALVLVVIGLLLGGAMYGVNPVIQSSKTATTNSKLKRIELALQAYVIQNGCLPCPADGSLAASSTDAGWSHSDADYYGPGGPASRACAAPAGNTCNTNGGAGANFPVGIVPWNTLGLREGDILDGWNSRISYAVTPSLTRAAGGSMVRTAPASYPAGTLVVQDLNATAQTSAAAYVLVSHGRDAAGAFNANGGQVGTGVTYGAGTRQGRNMPANNAGDNTTPFNQDTLKPVEGAATYFDDIVVYRTAPAVIQDCGPNACGNPSG